MLRALRRRGNLSKLCGGKKRAETKKNRQLVAEEKDGGRLPVSFEHEPRYSGGTRTPEARISLKCRYIKAHSLSYSFLISLHPLQSSRLVFTAPPQSMRRVTDTEWKAPHLSSKLWVLAHAAQGVRRVRGA